MGMIIHVYFALEIVRRRRWPGMVPAVALFPLYWVLHSLASFKALWQLIFRPYFWEKTTHGLTKAQANKDSSN